MAAAEVERAPEEAAGVWGWRRGEDGVERVMRYRRDEKEERP